MQTTSSRSILLKKEKKVTKNAGFHDTKMLVGISISTQRGMEVLRLSMADNPDHAAQIQRGMASPVELTLILTPRQRLDLANLLRPDPDRFDTPDARPN